MRYRDLLEIDNPSRVPRQKDLLAKLSPPIQWQRNPAEKNVRYESNGYYHVTPFLDKVLVSGVLKSKAQLEKDFRTAKEQYLDQIAHSPEYDRLPPAEREYYLGQMEERFVKNYGQTSTGLGAGSHLRSNHTVSLTYSYERAKEIYHQFKFVGMIAAGQVKTSAIYDYITAEFDFPDLEQLSPVDDVLIEFGVPRHIVQTGDVALYLDRTIITPERQYEFLQELEKAILTDEAEVADNSWGDYDEADMNDDGTIAIASQTIGFTASFSAIQSIRPENIGIIQCVIRKGAKIEHVGEEVEVRVNASDVAIIKYTRNVA